MAFLPGATQWLLPENWTEPTIQVRGLVFHSIVGTVGGAYQKFKNGSSLESTFLLRKNGEIIQLVNSDKQADAQYLGNAWYGSVETEDNGHPDTDPWTDAQLESLVEIASFYHHVHRVPLQRVPYNGGWGYGYHTMFGAPSVWTPVSKSCPGAIRKDQFHRVLLPEICKDVAPGTLTDMFEPADRELLKQAAADVHSTVALTQGIHDSLVKRLGIGAKEAENGGSVEDHLKAIRAKLGA